MQTDRFRFVMWTGPLERLLFCESQYTNYPYQNKGERPVNLHSCGLSRDQDIRGGAWPRKVKTPAKDHTAKNWENQDLNLSLNFKLYLLSTKPQDLPLETIAQS